MEELRVPVVAVAVEVQLAGGRALQGQVFVPASASSHPGPMRLDEWLNDATEFVPFRSDGEDVTLLLAKAAVVAMTTPGGAPHDPEVEGSLHRVRVEAGGRSYDGSVAFELPRLLDFLNRAERFFVVRDGERDHVVHKRHVTLAGEPAEG